MFSDYIVWYIFYVFCANIIVHSRYRCAHKWISITFHNAHHTTGYFVDQEIYFYLIFLNINVATCIEATAYVATETMLVMYLKHTCGMFKIAR